MEDIIQDLQLLEEADQLCIIAARAPPHESKQRCQELENCLQKLSVRARGMLDSGSTVNDVYVHQQAQLYKLVRGGAKAAPCLNKVASHNLFQDLSVVEDLRKLFPQSSNYNQLLQSLPAKAAAGEEHCRLGRLVANLSQEASSSLLAGTNFDDMEDMWHREVQRRNLALCHF